MIDLKQLVQDVMDGKQNPYEALYLLKDRLKTIKLGIEIVEVEAINSCEYEDKTFKSQGYEVTKVNGRKLWNFKGCKSYQIAKDNLKEIEDNLKASYSANENGLTMINEDSEVIELPIVTFTKDSLKVKKI